MTTATQQHGDHILHGNAAEYVAYQEGAIVSKEIVKNGAGTVTIFAFGKGHGLSEHTAPFDALVHVLDGTAEIRIDGVDAAYQAGQMVLMPATVPHALKAVQDFKMMLIMIGGK